MAHTKAAGKARQGTPRKGRRLGIKKFAGEKVRAGVIVLRQRGSSFHSGNGTKIGRDFTIFSLKEGTVKYRILRGDKMVEVI